MQYTVYYLLIGATRYANEASKNPSNHFNLQTKLAELVKDIESSKFSAHAYSVLAEDGMTTSESVLFGETIDRSNQKALKSKALFDRLSQYMEDQQLNTKSPNVFKLTPDIEPIPCKPLFFDLALNFVEFPSLDDKIGASASNRNKQQQEGISGFVKGFLGWGSKK